MRKYILLSVLSLFVGKGIMGQTVGPEAEQSIILLAKAWQLLDENADSIWPGWKGYKQKTIFIGAPGRYDLFINPKNELPAGFIRVYDSVLKQPVFYRDSSHMKTEMYAASVFIDGLSYRSACVAPYTPFFNESFIKYLESDYKMSQVSDEFKELVNSKEYYESEMIHEEYHLYQLNNKRLQTSAMDFYIKNPKIAALSFMEGQLLMEALYCNSIDSIKHYVHRFLSVRQKKTNLMQWKHINYPKNEKDGEWLEGCATYVQLKSLEILFNNEKAKLNSIKKLDSLVFLASIKIFGKSSGEKYYYYGLAEALILDKLCGNAWKSEIMEDRVYLQNLLSEYSGYNSKNENADFEGTIEEFHYNLLIKKIRKQFKAGNYFVEGSAN
jgi:hypothetical protein